MRWPINKDNKNFSWFMRGAMPHGDTLRRFAARDRAVFSGYGWPEGIGGKYILKNLLALDSERSVRTSLGELFLGGGLLARPLHAVRHLLRLGRDLVEPGAGPPKLAVIVSPFTSARTITRCISLSGMPAAEPPVVPKTSTQSGPHTPWWSSGRSSTTTTSKRTPSDPPTVTGRASPVCRYRCRLYQPTGSSGASTTLGVPVPLGS